MELGLQLIKNGKATEVNNIPGELIKHYGDILEDLIVGSVTQPDRQFDGSPEDRIPSSESSQQRSTLPPAMSESRSDPLKQRNHTVMLNRVL